MNIVSSGFTKSSIAKTEIELQGKHLSSYLRPGFNIAVLSGWTGTLEAFRSFDTRSKANADVSKMVTFLNNLPVDRIVVGVVKGDGYSGIQNNADAQQALVSVTRISNFTTTADKNNLRSKGSFMALHILCFINTFHNQYLLSLFVYSILYLLG